MPCSPRCPRALTRPLLPVLLFGRFLRPDPRHPPTVLSVRFRRQGRLRRASPRPGRFGAAAGIAASPSLGQLHAAAPVPDAWAQSPAAPFSDTGRNAAQSPSSFLRVQPGPPVPGGLCRAPPVPAGVRALSCLSPRRDCDRGHRTVPVDGPVCARRRRLPSRPV